MNSSLTNLNSFNLNYFKNIMILFIYFQLSIIPLKIKKLKSFSQFNEDYFSKKQ
jgi:hypothetical protein